MNKKFILFSGLVIASIALYVMRHNDHVLDSNLNIPLQSAEFRVGVTAGPHATIMRFVKTEAEKQGLNIKVIEFNDFILPNAALDHGDVMLNSYQHKMFLDDQVKNRGYNLVSVASSVVIPLGVYAFSLKSLDDLKQGTTVLIPNDSTNGSRALLLLQKLGLLKLKDTPQPTLLDITQNPKQLVIKELDAPTLPRAMVDADIALINTDWLFVAGLDPSKALAKEDKDSPYANLIVARAGTENDIDVKKFIAIYHSEPVRKFIESEFKGAVIPAF
ncbi:MAG: MetQ/NlpA family ABC transporter substrate-binding protein [Candidatus Paracaedibacteraceae bacterium]|nr:MetQ/NlpA family ABC transporter substrate-binding protein [Candidatus Paracaedibacteraceae bacterium]